MTNASCCKLETFFMNVLCIQSFCPHECTTESCPLVVQSSSTVTILTTETSLWTCVCTSDTWQYTYKIHYSCFTSICDLFTDSFIDWIVVVEIMRIKMNLEYGI
jgi:hypothetical protein